MFEAEKSFSSDPCRWATAGNGGEYGNEVSVLRGGAWAFEEARTLDSDVANAAAISLDGLSGDDSAWLRAGDMVSIDLVLGGNWINLWIITDSADRTADTATLTALAQAIVDGLQ